MNCERVRNLLSAYLDRELSPEESHRVRAHLVTCGGCNAEFEAEREIKETLGDLPSLEPPADFLPDLFHRLESEPAPGAVWFPSPLLRWAAVGAAAAVLLALPVVRQWRSAEYIVEARSLYRQHSLVSAGRPLADRALSSYYAAVAGDEGRLPGGPATADRVRLLTLPD